LGTEIAGLKPADSTRSAAKSFLAARHQARSLQELQRTLLLALETLETEQVASLQSKRRKLFRL
jgi:hypothetical protein